MILNFLFDKTPLYFFIQSFWRDEAFSYLLAKKNILEIISLTAQDFNPPMYYLFLHFWIKIFGKNEVILRIPSLIFFAINIYVIFLFLKKILKIKGYRIILYLLIFSFNPFLLYFAFEARMYSLLALLTTLSYYYYCQKKTIPYILFTTLSFYTHYFSFFVFLSQVFHFFIFKQKRDKFKIKTFFIPFSLFLPWLFFIFPKMFLNAQDFWLKKPKLSLFFSSFGLIFTGYESLYRFYERYINLLSLFFFLLIFYFFLLLIFKKIKIEKRNYFFLTLLLLWSIIPFLLIFFLSQIKPIFLLRYLIFTGVGFNLLVFFILEKLNKIYRLALIIIIFFFIFHYTKFEVKYKRKANFKKIFFEVKNLMKSNDLIYVVDNNASLYLLAAYYFGEKNVFIYQKTGREIPQYIGSVVIPKNKRVRSLPFYPKKAFVFENEYNYSIQSSIYE